MPTDSTGARSWAHNERMGIAFRRTVSFALSLLALSLLPVGCQKDKPPPAPLVDSGVHRRDSGPIIGHDHDAGPEDPIIDGTVGDAEWAGATTATSAVTSDEPGSTLTELRAILQSDRLAIAVTGTIADGDAIVVYVDCDFEGPGGLPSGTSLGDTVGTLDTAISQPSLVVPSGFRMDFAWGTAAMPHTAAGTDEVSGWRDVASDPAHFTTIAATSGPSVCSGTACEAAIPLDVLGGSAPRHIALFARIVRADGTLTNQTLPADDGAHPEVVSALLTLGDTTTPDGGVTGDGGISGDGGVFGDGGVPPTITIDGILDEGAWTTAAMGMNSVDATGTPFEGNSLTTLYAFSDGIWLYVGIEGSFTPGNAILMYVDRDVGGADGLVLSGISDPTGDELDRALSKTITIISSEVRLDFAWGTLDMGRQAVGDDTRMGWRDIDTPTTRFASISADVAPSACSDVACETAILLSDLQQDGELTTIGLAVRLGSATNASLSNQTLPEDSTGNAEQLSTYLEITPP